jgi:hypothetical protein
MISMSRGGNQTMITRLWKVCHQSNSLVITVNSWSFQPKCSKSFEVSNSSIRLKTAVSNTEDYINVTHKNSLTIAPIDGISTFKTGNSYDRFL